MMMRLREMICALVLCLLGVTQGCASPPEGVRWREDLRLVGPPAKESEDTRKGYLDVDAGFEAPGPDESSPEARPFFLYTKSGTFLSRVRGGRTALQAGEYIVIAELNGKYRQVQVGIQEGRMTHVSQEQLAAGYSVEPR